MNDTRFKELLNLYLDREASLQEVNELEAELKTNPARRRIYIRQCQMHKACGLLAERFSSEAPRVDARRVTEREPSGLFSGLPSFAYASAGFAAVCAVFIGVRFAFSPVAEVQSPEVAVVEQAPQNSAKPAAVFVAQTLPTHSIHDRLGQPLLATSKEAMLFGSQANLVATPAVVEFVESADGVLRELSPETAGFTQSAGFDQHTGRYFQRERSSQSGRAQFISTYQFQR